MWGKISSTARKNTIRKILIVSHVIGNYHTLDAYQVNANLASFSVSSMWKIAYVALEEKYYEQLKFAETVAVNRGFMGKVFKDETSAYNWLALNHNAN